MVTGKYYESPKYNSLPINYARVSHSKCLLLSRPMNNCTQYCFRDYVMYMYVNSCSKKIVSSLGGLLAVSETHFYTSFNVFSVHNEILH